VSCDSDTGESVGPLGNYIITGKKVYVTVLVKAEGKSLI